MVFGTGLKGYLVIKNGEYNIVVICLLPKQKTRVRFPLLAQKAKLIKLDISVNSVNFNDCDTMYVGKNY